ncbi:MAG: competence/damage-inducible protein A [Flavobacteriaceae bacterium]
MKAELITIGDEILIGQIVNTNATFLSKSLNKIGVDVVQITSVSDTQEAIIGALEAGLQRAEILILTGGLGPTKDDLTKHTLTAYFNDRLVLYPEILAHIEYIFKQYVESPIQQTNRDQANLPAAARIFKNEYGTASGMWFEKDGKVVVSLPGVPFEMKSLMQGSILPALQEKFDCPFIYHQTVQTYGLGESVIASRVEDWENKLPKSIKIAYLPSLGRVRIRLTSSGMDEKAVRSAVDEQVALLIDQIQDIYVGIEGEDPIELQIGKKLLHAEQTLAVAESCTGGGIAERITQHPGASAYFQGGVVAYDNRQKVEVLGVSDTTIATEGVVSAAVAAEMAQKAKALFQTDFAIATTGNAGPTSAEGKAPVGRVYIGLATPTGCTVEEFTFGNHRERVIQKAVNKAFELLFKALKI